MKLNKILIAIILILTLGISICTNVYAEDMRGTVTLTLEDPSKYKVGEEIIVNVSIEVTGFEGILFFYADVNYDNTVLKYEGVTPTSGWNLVNEDENVYLEKIGLKEGVGTICQLRFKVLKDTEDTTINLSSIDAAGNSGSVHYLYENVNSPTLVIKVPDTPDTPDVPDTPDTPDTPDVPDTSNTIDEPSTQNKIADNTTIKSTLPKTGDTVTGIIVIGIAVIILAVVLINDVKYTRK